jgi:hypothetical protein
MHFELEIEHNVTDSLMNNKRLGDVSCEVQEYDFLYLFWLPCGVYLDNYELASWPSLSTVGSTVLYLERDEVLCEKICGESDTHDNVTFAIEFKNQIVNATKILTFSIPLHKQYHFSAGNVDALYVNMTIAAPTSYIRKSSGIASSRWKKYYKSSYLGVPGNIGIHPSEVAEAMNFSLLSHEGTAVSEISFPIGNPADKDHYVLITSSVYLGITLLILIALVVY